MVQKNLYEISKEEIDLPEEESSEMITDVRFSDGLMQYKTLDTDEWQTLAEFEDIIASDITDIIEQNNLIVGQKELSKMQRIQSDLRSAWDEEVEMFRVTREMDEDGDLVGLIVNAPEIDEEITVVSLYDSDGCFDGEHIQEQLDKPIKSLWDEEMYTPSPWASQPSVYRQNAALPINFDHVKFTIGVLILWGVTIQIADLISIFLLIIPLFFSIGLIGDFKEIWRNYREKNVDFFFEC